MLNINMFLSNEETINCLLLLNALYPEKIHKSTKNIISLIITGIEKSRWKLAVNNNLYGTETDQTHWSKT